MGNDRVPPDSGCPQHGAPLEGAIDETLPYRYDPLAVFQRASFLACLKHLPRVNASSRAAKAMMLLLRQSPAARIGNLPSSPGSLTLNGDPASPYYAARLLGYNASRAALNMLTVQLAEELKETAIVVNSVSPGYVKTDLTGHNGFMTAEEGAKLPVKCALLGDDAVSGKFVEPER